MQDVKPTRSDRATGISAAGSFVSIPDAFPDAPAEMRNAVKLEFRTVFSEESRVQTLFSTDVALVDLRAVQPTAIDPKIVQRDCELLSQIVESNPEALGQLVTELQNGDSASLERAEQIATEAGLTEEAFTAGGGGFIFLVVVVAAAALAGGCATTNSNKPFKASTTPKPTPTPDAGAPDAGAPGGGGGTPR